MFLVILLIKRTTLDSNYEISHIHLEAAAAAGTPWIYFHWRRQGFIFLNHSASSSPQLQRTGLLIQTNFSPCKYSLDSVPIIFPAIIHSKELLINAVKEQTNKDKTKEKNKTKVNASFANAMITARKLWQEQFCVLFPKNKVLHCTESILSAARV